MAGLRRFSLNVDLTKIQFLLLLIAVISAQDGPIVETTQGRIRGAIDRTEAGEVTFIINIISLSDMFFTGCIITFSEKRELLSV